MNLSELFNEIWEERPHISEFSDKPLLPKGHYQWHWQFLHVLPHGSYKRYKFRKENIMLGLPDEHANQESNPKFRERYDQLKAQYNKETSIKSYIK